MEERNYYELVLFLHTHGYNFFNINKLTYSEVNTLVHAFNIKQKEKKKNKNNKNG